VDAAFRVGAWVVQPDLNTVSLKGDSLRLEPKVMQVLVCLASRPGTPFSKQEILKVVWRNTFVSDDVLTRAISELRRTFQDDVHDPKFIETIPRRGYRLIAPVQLDGAVVDPSPSHRGKKPAVLPHRQNRTRFLAALVLAALIAFLAILWRRQHFRSVLGETNAPEIHSIAVLPFKNLSQNTEEQYLADGLTQELITNLSQVHSLKVVAKTSSAFYADTVKALPQIALELGVDGIVKGSVARSGERVRVTAQLFQAAREKQVWAHSYETGMQNVVTFQRTLAREITLAVSAQTSPEEIQRLARATPVNPEAYDDYLVGEYYLWNQLNPEGRQEAVRYLERSVTEDPRYAPSHASLSMAYFRVAPEVTSSRPNIIFERSRAAAFKAAELDPSLPDAHRMIGIIDYVVWDLAAAGKEFERAVELQPGDPRNLYVYAVYLDAIGRHEDAISEAHRAAALDPLNVAVQSGTAKTYLYAGHYDEAIAEFSRILADAPATVEIRGDLAYAYIMRGDYSPALLELEKCQADLLAAPRCISLRGYVFAKEGDLAKARESLHELNRMSRSPGYDVSPLDFATLYAAMGDRDHSITWLRKGYREHGQFMLEIGSLPELASLHSDPRFDDLLRRLGLK
jgi:TolB-like protein/DNA-binding winged helix-turn-helix (wHTH) protein/tetratricopeptide (TPR) repeat protein